MLFINYILSNITMQECKTFTSPLYQEATKLYYCRFIHIHVTKCGFGITQQGGCIWFMSGVDTNNQSLCNTLKFQLHSSWVPRMQNSPQEGQLVTWLPEEVRMHVLLHYTIYLI